MPKQASVTRQRRPAGAPRHSTPTRDFAALPTVKAKRRYRGGDPLRNGEFRVVAIEGTEHRVPRHVHRKPSSWVVKFGSARSFPDAKHGGVAPALDAAIGHLREVWSFDGPLTRPPRSSVAPWDPAARRVYSYKGIGPKYSVPRHIVRRGNTWFCDYTKPARTFSDGVHGGPVRALEAAEAYLRKHWVPNTPSNRPKKGAKSAVGPAASRVGKQYLVNGTTYTVPLAFYVLKDDLGFPMAWEVKRKKTSMQFTFARFGGADNAYDHALSYYTSRSVKSRSELNPFHPFNLRAVRVGHDLFDAPRGVARIGDGWRCVCGNVQYSYNDAAYGGPAGALKEIIAGYKQWLAGNGWPLRQLPQADVLARAVAIKEQAEAFAQAVAEAEERIQAAEAKEVPAPTEPSRTELVPWLPEQRRDVSIPGRSRSLSVPKYVKRNRQAKCWFVDLKGHPVKHFTDRKCGGVVEALHAATQYLMEVWQPRKAEPHPATVRTMQRPTSPEACREVVVDGRSYVVPRYVLRDETGRDAWMLNWGNYRAFTDAAHGGTEQSLLAASQYLDEVWRPIAAEHLPRVFETPPWDPLSARVKTMDGFGDVSVPRYIARLPRGWQMRYTKPSLHYGDSAYGGVMESLDAAIEALKKVWSPKVLSATITKRDGRKRYE